MSNSLAKTKYPPHLYTIELQFGSFIPEFAKHFPTNEQAGAHLRALIARMNASKGACITRINLWHRGIVYSTYAPEAPAPKPMPPRDADGVRRYPEFGRWLHPAKTEAKPKAVAKATASPLASRLGLNRPQRPPGTYTKI